MADALVSFDTDKIKQYVFATGTLKEIVGASAIIDNFNRSEMFGFIKKIDPSAQKIFSDAGAGLFRVDLDRAEQIINKVTKEFWKRTISCSISGAYLPFSGDEDLSDTLKLLGLRLRNEKDSKNYRILKAASTSFTKTCDSCGSDYAKHSLDRRDSTQEEFLCESCFLKREKDKEMKKNMNLLLNNKREKNLLYTWDRIIDGITKDSVSEDDSFFDVEPPESFTEIGDVSKPSNYMAVIYLDGDNFGSYIKNIKSLDELSAFSEAIDSYLTEAIICAVREHLMPVNGIFPFNILFHGGDDLLMVVPADKGIAIANTISEIFASKAQSDNYPLTLSGAVIIAHAKHPFHSLLGLAEESLHFAKNLGAKRKRNNPGKYDNQGFINFQVVHAGSSRSFYDEYESLYVTTKTLSRNQITRTLRPYTCEELKKLQGIIGIFAKESFPRNKLYALQECLFQDYGNAMLGTIKIISRLSKENRLKLDNALNIFSPVKADIRPPWFQQDDGSWASPFLDIVELYKFAGGR